MSYMVNRLLISTVPELLGPLVETNLPIVEKLDKVDALKSGDQAEAACRGRGVPTLFSYDFLTRNTYLLKRGSVVSADISQPEEDQARHLFEDARFTSLYDFAYLLADQNKFLRDHWFTETTASSYGNGS
ncbi:hypothetical protein BDQ17DRAFT_1328923 [Cyathus striatus]|nr:hypothetical protein BDQ17DRAFT_1328923 [Cyathus striatus]